MNFYELKDQSINLGNSCNLSCVYCYEKNKHVIKNREEIFKEIDDILLVQNESCTLTGGEPTVHKDFFEILQYCLNKFQSVVLLSNCLEFKNKFKELISLNNLNKLNLIIPFDSVDEKIHNFLCQRNVFKDKIRIINNLYQERKMFSKITIGILVSSINLLSIEKTCKHIVNNWSDFSIFFKVINLTDFSEEKIKNLTAKYSVIFYILKPIFDFLDKKNIEYFTIHQPFCYMVGYEDKTLEYKVLETIYNSKDLEKNLSIFKNDFSENKFFNKCDVCIHFKYCTGINFRYVDIFGSDEFIGVKGNKLFNEKW